MLGPYDRTYKLTSEILEFLINRTDISNSSISKILEKNKNSENCVDRCSNSK